MMNPETLISSLSLLVSACALVISIVLFRKTRQATVQPMLVFARRDEDKLWHLQNVGNGPALNLVVADGHRIEGWATTTNCDALAAGGSITLDWLKIASKLGAAYTDVYGRPYHTICEQYRNRITVGELMGIPSPANTNSMSGPTARHNKRVEPPGLKVTPTRKRRRPGGSRATRSAASSLHPRFRWTGQLERGTEKP